MDSAVASVTCRPGVPMQTWCFSANPILLLLLVDLLILLFFSSRILSFSHLSLAFHSCVFCPPLTLPSLSSCFYFSFTLCLKFHLFLFHLLPLLLLHCLMFYSFSPFSTPIYPHSLPLILVLLSLTSRCSFSFHSSFSLTSPALSVPLLFFFILFSYSFRQHTLLHALSSFMWPLQTPT